MIRPVRNSGWSARNSHASVNISSGPNSQFSASDAPISRRSPASAPMSS